MASHWPAETLQEEFVRRCREWLGTNLRPHVVAHHHFAGSRFAAQPRGEVGHTADGRVVDARREADGSEGGDTHADADRHALRATRGTPCGKQAFPDLAIAMPS